MHGRCAGTASGRTAGDLAPVLSQRIERTDEHRAAARRGCSHQSADARKTLPESQRPSFARQLSDQHADADVCHGTVGAGRHPCRHFVRSVHLFCRVSVAAVSGEAARSPLRRCPCRGRASLCPAGAALLKGTAGHPSPDFVPRRHQFHRVGLQRGIPRHAALPPRRRRGCSGCRQHRYGSRAAFGQCRRLGAAAAVELAKLER